jgi:predicted anti-sigma-YlaC factor YlaD
MNSSFRLKSWCQKLNCEQARKTITAPYDGNETSEAQALEHVTSCPSCSAWFKNVEKAALG